MIFLTRMLIKPTKESGASFCTLLFKAIGGYTNHGINELSKNIGLGTLVLNGLPYHPILLPIKQIQFHRNTFREGFKNGKDYEYIPSSARIRPVANGPFNPGKGDKGEANKGEANKGEANEGVTAKDDDHSTLFLPLSESSCNAAWPAMWTPFNDFASVTRPPLKRMRRSPSAAPCLFPTHAKCAL